MASEKPIITANFASYILPISNELLRQAEEDRQAVIEARARWEAMTPAERAQTTAEREAREAAAKAERTCKHCGCDPDEHGGY